MAEWKEEAIARTLRNVRGIPKCGCYYRACECGSGKCPTFGAQFILCKMHETAPDLLALVESFVRALSPQRSEMDLQDARKEARALLAQIGGKP